MKQPAVRVVLVVVVAFAGLLAFLHSVSWAPRQTAAALAAAPAPVQRSIPDTLEGAGVRLSLNGAAQPVDAGEMLKLVAYSAAHASEPWATVYVFITEDGFNPETLTVTVGTKVVWTNATAETVSVAGEGLWSFRVYLPLVMRVSGDTMGSTLNSWHAPLGIAQDLSIVQLAPGESIWRIFTQVEIYEYVVGGAVTGSSTINVEPHEIDDAALAWAKGPAGILLRWRWPHTDRTTGGVAPQPTGYNVYRNGERVNTILITHETQTVPFEATMGTHWAWFQSTYSDVTTIAEFHTFLDTNPLAEHWLADQRYPIALVRGLGYLDSDVLPGIQYNYRVEAIVGGAPSDMGTIRVTYSGVTPVVPPSVVTATTVVSDALRSSPDWPVAQRNRQAHGRIHLVWDLPQPGAGETAPQVWTTSYDVFRAGPVAQGQDPGTLVYAKLTTEEAVVPMPANEPTPITTTFDTYGQVPYDQHPYFFVDELSTPCTTYAYRVAARDMLGQAGVASTWVTATVPDTMPPAPPDHIGATPDHLAGTIEVTWTLATDAVSYALYRADTPTAGWPGVADCSTTPCWVTMTQTSLASWSDTSAAYEHRYWYIVRAWDAPCGNYPPNGSAPSLAVAGTLHDRTPPGDPSVFADPDAPDIHIVPDPDTVYSLLYCRFDEDPTDGYDPPRVLISEIPSTTTTFDVSAYYSASLPISVTCWAQPVDANGNRGNLVVVDKAVSVCPSGAYTLTTPTIDTILTEQGGTNGWTSILTWTVDAPLPQVKGYRVYRQEGTGALTDITNQIAVPLLDRSERSFRDITVKPGEVYTYVLAAIRPACGAEFIVDTEVRSGPRLYTIRPTLDTPDLDPCVRPVADVAWGTRPQVIPQGVYMQWLHPYGDQHHMLTVIYRSRNKDGDYVAITPPFASLTGEYTDAQAPDTQFWYIATVLNWATGEIVYRTPPTSVVGSGLMALALPKVADLLEVAQLPEGPRVLPQRSVAQSAFVAPQDVTASPEFFDPVGDATVSKWSPTTNYSATDRLHVGYSIETSETVERSFVQFDIASLPVGAKIDHVEFGAYVDEFAGESVDVGLRAAWDAWTEITVTWNTQPAMGPGTITRTVIAQSQWITWELTELASHWHQNPTQNYGFALDTASDLDHQVGFSSREAAANPPRLVVHYFAPPEVLRFGVGADNVFELNGITYLPGSTPDCLTGDGTVLLGGGDAGGPYERIAGFTCIQADFGSGNVLTGTATVNLQGTIQLAYPGGFTYTLTSLSLNEDGGYGNIDLILPRDASFQFQGTTLDPVPLTTATIYQDLRFLHLRPAWQSSCTGATPQYAFAMEPLPLLIVPTAGVTITQMAVEIGAPCTQYVDRYNGTRPALSVADSNDGYLRPSYAAIQPTFIFPNGVSGGFNTMAQVSYTTAMPYGFEIAVSGGITFELHANRIDNGHMADVAVGLDYYRRPAGKVLTTTLGSVPPLDGRFDGEALGLNIGPDGELTGNVWNGVWGTPAQSVTWAGGGFRLDDEIYFLYVPPVQTNVSVKPDVQAAAAWSDWDSIQAGLNRVTQSDDSAAFTWQCCSSGEAITFPDGVQTDLYLRRGGVSDLVVANLTPPGLATKIFNYDTLVTSFRISFCDNAIYDSDVAGDVDLPYPADVTIPLVDMVLNPNTACVDSGKVNTNKLTLSHWQIDIGPRRVEFRKRAVQAGDPENWTKALWILGTMDVPHVTTVGSEGAAAVPLESAWKYDGTWIAGKVVQDKVNFTFDGFHYLFKTLSLSAYPQAPNEPQWQSAATLAEAPTVISGFVKLQGNVLAPSYGTVIVENTKKPPDLYVLGWDDYVGFSAVPYAERRWTELAGLTWGFDLLYAQHHDATTPRGAFVGFRKDSIYIAELDQALVLASWTTTPGTDLLLGLSAGTGALRALAETTVPSLGTLDTTLVASMTAWATKLGCSSAYVNFLQAKISDKTFWSQYTSSKGYEDTTALMDAWSNGNEKDIPTTPVGGGTTGVVSDMGVELNKMRGVVSWDSDVTTSDSHFEKLEISLWLNIQQPGDTDPLVHADYINFSVDRDGDYVLIGEGIKVELYEYKLPKIDIYIGINVDKPTFEGNVAIYKLEIEGLILEKAAAIVGVGDDLFYVGALIHDAHPKYSDSYKMGGAILLGRIDPTSKVLQAGSFGYILKDIGATGGTLTLGKLNGAYVRVYGQFPLYDWGCIFRVKAGGEIAGWYFATDSGCDAYGGRLRANITGKLLCVVSGRGDMTIQIYRKILPGNACADSASFKGQFWVAGGIGFCDPDSWKSWASRWWGDSWCWTAGAMVAADYNDSKAGEWNWNYDSDYE